MGERKRIENLDELVGKTISRVASKDGGEYLTFIFDDDSFLHVSPQEHWLGEAPWLKFDEELNTEEKIAIGLATDEEIAEYSKEVDQKRMQRLKAAEKYERKTRETHEKLRAKITEFYQCEDCGEKSI